MQMKEVNAIGLAVMQDDNEEMIQMLLEFGASIDDAQEVGPFDSLVQPQIQELLYPN